MEVLRKVKSVAKMVKTGNKMRSMVKKGPLRKLIGALTPKYPVSVRPKRLAKAYAASMRFKETKRDESGDVIMAPAAIGRVARFGNNPFGTSRIIKNTDMICSIPGSVAFAYTAVTINPGYYRTFPWLSEVAAGYQYYRFRSIRFRFETTSPSSAKGQIILAPEYCVTDPVPTSEQAACNSQGAVATTCWNNLSLEMDTSAMFAQGSRKFIRQGLNGIEGSLCDAGRLIYSTVGMVDTSVIGRLWVDYVVELSVQQTVLPNVQTSRVQLLGFDNSLTLADDALAHPIPLVTRTQPLFIPTSGVSTNRQVLMSPGIYRVTGSIGIFGSGAVGMNGVINIWLRWNSDTSGYPPPYLNAMRWSGTYASSGAAMDSFGIQIPISFVCRSDTVGDFFVLDYQRDNTSFSGTVQISSTRTNLMIEAI